MKEYPILFSTPMVQAILAGRKTQTRRVVKVQRPLYLFVENGIAYEQTYKGTSQVKCPYGQVGDILWVKETWARTMDIKGKKPLPDAPIYKADFEEDYPVDWKWKPSIHMPKAACRLWLRITSVRVERLRDITEGDAISEGIGKDDAGWWIDYVRPDQAGFMLAENSFRSLWQSINGEQSWKDDPWVWVVEFEVASNTRKEAIKV